MLSLQRFDFDIEFVPGKFLYTADVLSRFVQNTPQIVQEIDLETEPPSIDSMHQQMKTTVGVDRDLWTIYIHYQTGTIQFI